MNLNDLMSWSFSFAPRSEHLTDKSPLKNGKRYLITGTQNGGLNRVSDMVKLIHENKGLSVYTDTFSEYKINNPADIHIIKNDHLDNFDLNDETCIMFIRACVHFLCFRQGNFPDKPENTKLLDQYAAYADLSIKYEEFGADQVEYICDAVDKCTSRSEIEEIVNKLK